jgi:hypothetical protein
MANKKISELSTRTPSLSDLMLVGDPSSGYSYKCTITSLATIIETDIADGYVTLSTTQTISGAKTFSNNLTLTSVSNAGVDTDKFLVLNGSNVVNFRTGSEVLSDIGGQGALTLTTTGTSGAATLVGNTLNIPQYQAVLTNPVTGTGTTNYIPKFTGTSAIGNSIMYEGTFAIGIGTITPFGGSSNYTALDLRGTVGSIIALGNTSNSITGRFLELSATSSNAQIFSLNSAPLSFGTESLSRLSIDTSGNVTISVIANATTDTDKFLVSDSGVIKYRTGAEVLSDIGGQAALTNPITGTGVNNQAAFFTGTNTIAGSSVLVLDGSNIAIGQAAAAQKLSVNGDVSITTINNATTDTDKFLVSDGGVIKYRTGSEVLSDIGAAASTSISGTTNYIPKFTSSSAIGNSQIFDNGTNVGIGTTIPGNKLTVSNGSDVGYLDFNNQSFILGTSTGSGISLFSSSATGVMTFSTNSTLRMTLDASGNLGLGVTPSAWESSTALQLGNQYAFTKYGMTRNAVYNAGYKYIANGFANSFEMNGGAYEWYTAPSGTATNNITFTKTMTLDASGNLGLGVTPSAWGASEAMQFGFNYAYGRRGITRNAYFDGADYRYITTAAATLFQQDGGGQYIWYQAPSGTAGNAISFTQAMTLDADGLLNVGGTGGTKRLNVFGDSRILNVAPTLDFTLSTNTAFSHSIVASNYSSSPISSNTLEFRVASGASTQATVMTLNGAGNVGIGTTSPAYKITTSGGSSEGAIGIERTTVGTNTVIGALNFTNNNAGTVYGRVRGGRNAAGDGYVSLGTGVGDNLYAIEGGNVGIGTTSPNAPLSLSGSADVGMRIKAGASALSYIDFDEADSGTPNGSIAYNHGTNAMTFATGGSNDEKMRITSGGNVGIGTTSPDAQLVTNGSTSSRINMRGGDVRYGTLYADNGLFAVSSITSIPLVFATNDIEKMRITSGGNVWVGNDSNPMLEIANSGSTDVLSGIKWSVGSTRVDYGGIYSATSSANNNYISFYTKNSASAPSERIRITSGGELLIDATTNSATSDVGSKFVSNGRLYTVSSYDDNTQESLSMYSTTASAYRFYVGWGGTVYATNTTISAISDARFKENVRDLDSALNKLMLLKPRVFDWKEGKGKNIKNDKGFIAQEFEQIFPELVDKWKEQAPQGEEAYKSIRQDLIPYLVKAIQELKAEIEILKNK